MEPLQAKEIYNEQEKENVNTITVVEQEEKEEIKEEIGEKEVKGDKEESEPNQTTNINNTNKINENIQQNYKDNNKNKEESQQNNIINRENTQSNNDFSDNFKYSIIPENINILNTNSDSSKSLNETNDTIIVKKKYSIEDFEIINKIGKGSFAKVYLARNKNNNKLVALKAVDKQFIEKVNKRIIMNYILIFLIYMLIYLYFRKGKPTKF